MFSKLVFVQLITVIIGLHSSIFAQNQNSNYLEDYSRYPAYNVEELQADFNQMRQTLEENHESIYEYTSRKALDSLFNYQFSLIDRPLLLREFYKILTPVTAKVGCGHTAVWMPSSFWARGSQKLFPLQIRLIEDYVVVAGSYSDTSQIPYGSVILTINDRPAGDIIAEMEANYSADAFNIHFIRKQIERRFPMIFARRFGFSDRYKISYALPGRKTSDVAVLTPATLESVRTVVFANFEHPELTIEIIEEKNTAVMTIPTFIYYDRVSYFEDFVDSSFALIREKGIENLILDLRGNDGGDPFCSVPLFSYLQPKPLPYYVERYGKYSQFADPIPLPDNHFTGNLYTLIDGRCFSTNGHFCALLSYHNIGKFIGTPTGATYKCNAGKNTHVTLENTGIMLYFGRSTFAAAVEDMDKTKPIYPHYPVEETYRGFLDGEDLFMEMVFWLIEGM